MKAWLGGKPPDGAFEIWSQPGLAVITAPKEVDARNAQQFWQALAEACPGRELVVVDMTATQACGLDVLSVLIMALRYTGAGGIEIRVAASAAVRDLIASTDVRFALGLYDSVDEALRALPRSNSV